MTTDLDRRRLAAAAELERFEADEHRRLAYADRAETLERVECGDLVCCSGCRCTSCQDGGGLLAEIVSGMRPSETQPIVRFERLIDDGPQSPLADGTGRHSRKEMAEATQPKSLCAACNFTFEHGVHRPDSYWVTAGYEPHHAYVEPTQTIAGVQFTSVPQLCAAYEYALSTLKALYLQVDLKQHAWQPEQEVMREARRLLLAAGKDVE